MIRTTIAAVLLAPAVCLASPTDTPNRSSIGQYGRGDQSPITNEYCTQNNATPDPQTMCYTCPLTLTNSTTGCDTTNEVHEVQTVAITETSSKDTDYTFGQGATLTATECHNADRKTDNTTPTYKLVSVEHSTPTLTQSSTDNSDAGISCKYQSESNTLTYTDWHTIGFQPINPKNAEGNFAKWASDSCSPHDQLNCAFTK